MTQLVWTRPLLFRENDYRILKEREVSFLHFPCLSYDKISPSPLAKKTLRTDVFVFTNYYSALLFTENYEPTTLLSKIYTMSLKAHEFLRQKGFESTLIESKKAEFFGKNLFPLLNKNQQIYLVGPEIRAYDLKIFLEKKGFQTKNVNAYRTVRKFLTINGKAFSQQEKISLLGRNDLVFSFFSPSAADAFLSDFKEYKKILIKKHRVITIGETTHKFCQDFFAESFQAKETTAESVLDRFLELKNALSRTAPRA